MRPTHKYTLSITPSFKDLKHRREGIAISTMYFACQVFLRVYEVWRALFKDAK